MKKAIWVGFDPRESDAVAACVSSIRAHLTEDIPIFAVVLNVLQGRGLYQRPTEVRDGRLFDVISDAPMSTEFAISRFFMPELSEGYDAVVFLDCDMLARANFADLFALLDPSKAVQVVKHEQEVGETIKMDNQIQTSYPRKNWSSVMLWNLAHPANRNLNLFKLNQWSGRALHQLLWLENSEIGDLPPEWNHLVGVNPPNPDAKLVHYTLGIPRMAGYYNCEFAEEWRQYAPTAH